MNKRFTHQLSLLLVANMFFWGNANGQELITQVANSGFEDWEVPTFSPATTEQEPVHWSSFRTCYSANLLTNAARGKQVEISPVVRPGSQGTKSAVIWARSVLTIAANGNLTTGQIQAGSTTAANLANHNKTIRSNPDFNMPFTARPDSLTVWTKYIPKNTAHQARVAAIIHGDNDYKDPNNGSDEIYVVGKAALDYSATEDYGWQRLSIPFDYESFVENDEDPKYILISITTNKTPGVGTIGDSVYVDDMLMIYNPTLKAENTSGKGVFASGDMLSVDYTITGTMSPYNLNAATNVVSLELSDALGSFDAPTVLDYATTNESGVFSVKLPNLENGDGYKVRVVTTNYPMTSDELSFSMATPATITTTATDNEHFGCNPEEIDEPEFTVTDECDASAVATVTTTGPTNTDGCNYSQTWTANYTPVCGGSAPTLSITYTWVNDTPASINTTADNADLGKNPTVTKPEFTVTDECNPSAEPAVATDGPINTGDNNYSQTWTATYTSECGIEATSVSITYTWIQTTVSLETVAAESTASVYPNPVSETLFVKCAEAEKAAIYTLNGLKVAEVNVTENGINVSGYAKGVYIIAIEAKEGSVYRTLFVKE